MKKELIFVMLNIFIFSCAPTKKEVQMPQPQRQVFVISSSDILPYTEIEQRIKTLANFMNKTSLSEQEKDDIKEIIRTYNLIKAMSFKGYMNQNEVKSLINMLFYALSTVEDKYISIIQKKPDVPKIIKELEQKKLKVIQSYKEGKYTDVVNRCLELKLKYGPSIMTPDLGIIFAISLGEIGMLKEAIDVGEKVYQKISYLPDYVTLKERMEEWQKKLKEAELPEVEKEEVEALGEEEKKEEKVNINILITNARRLIEQENFEQALGILNKSGIENNKEIEVLKEKAIEGIINRDRNKAAKFFLLAKESKDPKKKKEYLEAAYRILEALIIQYPTSPLIDRIKANLEKVSEELKSLPISSTSNIQ